MAPELLGFSGTMSEDLLFAPEFSSRPPFMKIEKMTLTQVSQKIFNTLRYDNNELTIIIA